MREEIDLDAFHRGEQALFDQLVRTHSPRLIPHLRGYAGAAADVHDLLQEVWLRAYAKRQTFDGHGSLFGWLLTVSRTVGLAAVRKSGPATEELSDVAPASIPEGDVLLDTIRRAVLALPARQREVVLLRLVEGMSTAETARLLHCAAGTIKATLHAAVRRLREMLRERVR